MCLQKGAATSQSDFLYAGPSFIGISSIWLIAGPWQKIVIYLL